MPRAANGVVYQRTQHICMLLVSSLVFLHQIWCRTEATHLITPMSSPSILSPPCHHPHLITPSHHPHLITPITLHLITPSHHPQSHHPHLTTHPHHHPSLSSPACPGAAPAAVAVSAETPRGDAADTRRGSCLFCSFISSVYVSFTIFLPRERAVPQE